MVGPYVCGGVKLASAMQVINLLAHKRLWQYSHFFRNPSASQKDCQPGQWPHEKEPLFQNLKEAPFIRPPRQAERPQLFTG